MCLCICFFFFFFYPYATAKRSHLFFLTVTFKSISKVGGSIYHRHRAPHRSNCTRTPLLHTHTHKHTHNHSIGPIHFWTNHWPSLCNLWGRSVGHSSMWCLQLCGLFDHNGETAFGQQPVSTTVIFSGVAARERPAQCFATFFLIFFFWENIKVINVFFFFLTTFFFSPCNFVNLC